jgi:alpha-tubulin suppressor-like RCC1 family protein
MEYNPSFDRGRSNAVRVTAEKIMDSVVAASSGISNYMAVKSDGSLWTWDNNSNGELGDGTKEYRTEPMKIIDPITAVSINHSYVLAYVSSGASSQIALLAVGANSVRPQVTA